MPSLLDKCGRWYGIYTAVLLYVQDLLLLVIRLYWGWQFAKSGWHKLLDLDGTARYFANLGIFWPKFNALLSGCTELSCGLLLLIGLAARIITVPLVFNMIIAFLTNSLDHVRNLFSNPNDFVTAPEFLFLFAAILVLVFGAGTISIDGLLGYLWRRRVATQHTAENVGPIKSATGSPPPTAGRREFARLTVAVVAGLIAGALIRRGGEPAAAPAGSPQPEPSDVAHGNDASPKSSGPEQLTRDSGSAAEKPSEAKDKTPQKPAPADIDANLLLQDKHICRGLNTCKGKGKDHKNSCAGQGTCAIASSHACNGLNDCKGQGGCDAYPGQNKCEGKGACAVPLKDKTWKIARKKFEQLMAAKGTAVGKPPAKES